MRIIEHKSICKEDMEYLRGTEIMINMQRNRMVITYEPNDRQLSYSELSLTDTQGLVFVRNLDSRKDTIEILFEDPDDMKKTREKLVYYKMNGNEVAETPEGDAL